MQGCLTTATHQKLRIENPRKEGECKGKEKREGRKEKEVIPRTSHTIWRAHPPESIEEGGEEEGYRKKGERPFC